MRTSDIAAEIARIKEQFAGADENKLKALEGLIEQAAYERLFLIQLNRQALESGLIEVHPENAKLQRQLPIANTIAKHSAAYTNIMDKLLKHLAVDDDWEDDELDEFI